MALPVSVPYTFGNANNTVSLSWLDSDFSTVTNTINGIGNGTVTLSSPVITNLSVANISATNAIISNGTITSAISSSTATATGATTSRTLANYFADIINVKDFGATGNGSTDDTAAIQTAINSFSSGSETLYNLYFPTGTYVVSSTITITAKNVILSGPGFNSAVIRPTTTISGAVFYFNYTGGTLKQGAVLGLGIRDTGYSSTRTAYIKLANDSGGYFRIENCMFFGQATDAIIRTDTINFLNISNTNVEAYGGRVFWATNTGYQVTNCYWRRFNTYTNGNLGATVLIQGTSTSSTINNSVISGGGQENVVNISSITSNATTWTVTTTVSNLFQTGDRVLIQGCTPSTYNGLWEVASPNTYGTVFTITQSGNPGTTSVNGTAGYPMTCLQIDSSAGPVNESRFENLLLEACTVGTAYDFGSCSLLLAGNFNYTIRGNIFNNIYCDYGQTSIIITSKQITVGDWSVNYTQFSNILCQASRIGIDINSLQVANFNNITTNYISGTNANPSRVAALYINNDVEPSCEDLIFTNCNFGSGQHVSDSSFAFNYGVGNSQGAYTGDRFVFTGCRISGLNGGFQSGLLSSTSNAKLQNNLVSGGSSNALSNFIPSVESASTIDLPYCDIITITGTTTILTMTSGWVGRQVQLITNNAITFTTGGNIFVALTTVAGQLVNCVFDGSNWHLR